MCGDCRPPTLPAGQGHGASCLLRGTPSDLRRSRHERRPSLRGRRGRRPRRRQDCEHEEPGGPPSRPAASCREPCTPWCRVLDERADGPSPTAGSATWSNVAEMPSATSRERDGSTALGSATRSYCDTELVNRTPSRSRRHPPFRLCCAVQSGDQSDGRRVIRQMVRSCNADERRGSLPRTFPQIPRRSRCSLGFTVSTTPSLTCDFSALGGTRTPNLLIRSQMLFPIELRARGGGSIVPVRSSASRGFSSRAPDLEHAGP